MAHPWAQIVAARDELKRRVDGAELWDDVCEAAAGEYARLMMEAGVKSRHAARRLQHAGLTYEGAWEVVGRAEEAKVLAQKQAEDAQLADAVPLCPHCLAPLGQFDHFCPKCAGPVTAIASMDPMGQIYSAGRAYRLAATDKKPKGIVVLGMWMVFGPGLISVLWALSMFASSWGWNRFGDSYVYAVGDETSRAIALFFILGIFVLYTAILLKVTAHWLQSQRQPPADALDPPDADQESAGDQAEDGDSIEPSVDKNA